jgi:hypothetical protein
VPMASRSRGAASCNWTTTVCTALSKLGTVSTPLRQRFARRTHQRLGELSSGAGNAVHHRRGEQFAGPGALLGRDAGALLGGVIKLVALGALARDDQLPSVERGAGRPDVLDVAPHVIARRAAGNERGLGLERRRRLRGLCSGGRRRRLLLPPQIFALLDVVADGGHHGERDCGCLESHEVLPERLRSGRAVNTAVMRLRPSDAVGGRGHRDAKKKPHGYQQADSARDAVDIDGRGPQEGTARQAAEAAHRGRHGGRDALARLPDHVRRSSRGR